MVHPYCSSDTATACKKSNFILFDLLIIEYIYTIVISLFTSLLACIFLFYNQDEEFFSADSKSNVIPVSTSDVEINDTLCFVLC